MQISLILGNLYLTDFIKKILSLLQEVTILVKIIIVIIIKIIKIIIIIIIITILTILLLNNNSNNNYGITSQIKFSHRT